MPRSSKAYLWPTVSSVLPSRSSHLDFKAAVFRILRCLLNHNAQPTCRQEPSARETQRGLALAKTLAFEPSDF